VCQHLALPHCTCHTVAHHATPRHHQHKQTHTSRASKVREALRLWTPTLTRPPQVVAGVGWAVAGWDLQVGAGWDLQVGAGWDLQVGVGWDLQVGVVGAGLAVGAGVGLAVGAGVGLAVGAWVAAMAAAEVMARGTRSHWSRRRCAAGAHHRSCTPLWCPK
jgi:hypothetical protein